MKYAIAILLFALLGCGGVKIDDFAREATKKDKSRKPTWQYSAGHMPSGAFAPTMDSSAKWISPGIWANASEVASLPTSGSPWNNLVTASDSAIVVQLDWQEDPSDQYALACGLRFIRTGETAYRDKVRAACLAVVNSGPYLGRALALGRNLAGYVAAADMIKLVEFDPALDLQFRQKILYLREVVTTQNGSIHQCHDQRPHNWGGMCGASRMAVDYYLQDWADMALAATTLRGWLGNLSAYSGFNWTDQKANGIQQYWEGPIANIVPIGPVGQTFQGHSADGFEFGDMYRGCDATGCNPAPWPPTPTNYPWACLSGVLTQARIYSRVPGGRKAYDPFTEQSSALKRAYQYLRDLATVADLGANSAWWTPAQTFDAGQIWLVNSLYGTTFPTSPAQQPGNRNLANDFSDWLFAP